MKLFLVLVVSMLPMLSFAQSKIVSIDAFEYSYSGGLSFKHEEGKKVSDRDNTTFKFNLNYAQSLPEYTGLMWKAQVYMNRENIDWGKDGDTLNSVFGLGGGVLYNFSPDDIKNSILAGAMIGMERERMELNHGEDYSGFNLFLTLEAGKRWDLGSYSSANISYAPTVSFNLKRYGGDIRDENFTSSRDFRINFLKFDILF